MTLALIKVFFIMSLVAPFTAIIDLFRLPWILKGAESYMNLVSDYCMNVIEDAIDLRG